MSLDVARLLEGALRIPSVHPNEGRVAEYLVRQIRPYAQEARIDDVGNVVARIGTGKRRIAFLGHIDTVPGEVAVRVEEGRLFGRGAVDAKGPFCSALAAASRLSTATLERIELLLVGAVGEETSGSPGARHLLRSQYRPDLLIIGEPSGWDGITLGYKGRLLVTVEAVRDSFHSAADERTAAEEVVAVWNAAVTWQERFNEGRDKVFDQVQLALQEIVSAGDGVEQRCRAVFGLRLPLDLNPSDAREQLEEALPAGTGRSYGGAERAYRSERDSALTRAFRTAIRTSGGTPRLKLKTGTSDMNVVAPVWDVPVVAYGPGDSSLDHTPYEHVELAELKKAVAVLERVIDRLAL